jgi:uncharacterized protein YcbX
VAHFAGMSSANFDPRRFQPSIYVESASGIDGLMGFEWVGRNLRIGELELAVKARTIRCSMPARGQEQYGLEASPATAKAIYQATNRYLGVYSSVVKPGGFKRGDAVTRFCQVEPSRRQFSRPVHQVTAPFHSLNASALRSR